MGLLGTLGVGFCFLAIVSESNSAAVFNGGSSASSGNSRQLSSANDLLPVPVAFADASRKPPQRRLAEELTPEGDVCAFYKSGFGGEKDEVKWGSLGLCTIPEGYKWARRACARCRDCLSEVNLCEAPPRLLIHQYLNHLDKEDWRGNLLSLKAYLMTQDLRNTELILWSDDPDSIVNNDTRPFFEGFASNIKVRKFDYAAEVKGTVLEGDAYFGSEAAIKASVPEGKMASYSDLVRYILLHNYGGLWIDGDTVLMQDVYGVTVKVGYQFAMRWMNAHVFYVKRQSPLSKRILAITKTMPLNHPNFEQEIVEKICKPAGYFVVVDFDNFTDIWAFCVLRLVIHNDNTGAPDNILYDQPLGWWDAHWPGSHSAEGCYTNDNAVSDSHFEDYVGKSMALHTRYPGHNGHQPVPNSPLGRVKDIIDAFFAACSHTACMPEQAMPLLAYWHADSDTKPYPLPKNPFGSSVPKLAPGEDRGAGGSAEGNSSIGNTAALESGSGNEKGWERVGPVVDPSLQEDDFPETIGASSEASEAVARVGTGLLNESVNAQGRSESRDDLFKPVQQRHRVQHHKNKWTWGHKNK
ncbi:hypothetical protein COCOBI_10-3950 [Coccomyxa sp. Obi]|nr:hypothetical protein COCOBI_10-3950 [Coccomyxa sp. Obi]